MDSSAGSVWELGSAVRTTKGETCFTLPAAPTGVQMKNATASAMVAMLVLLAFVEAVAMTATTQKGGRSNLELPKMLRVQ